MKTVTSVELTGAELGQIEAGTTITKTSGATNGHVHTFSFRKIASSGSDSGGGSSGGSGGY